MIAAECRNGVLVSPNNNKNDALTKINVLSLFEGFDIGSTYFKFICS